jgi:hypothetical protein
MALKYSCPQCGAPIIIKFLKIGDKAWCKACGTESIVPDSAIGTEEEQNYDSIQNQQLPVSVAVEPISFRPMLPFGKLISITLDIFIDNKRIFIALAVLPFLLSIFTNTLHLPMFFGRPDKTHSVSIIGNFIDLILMALIMVSQIPIDRKSVV